MFAKQSLPTLHFTSAPVSDCSPSLLNVVVREVKPALAICSPIAASTTKNKRSAEAQSKCNPRLNGPLPAGRFRFLVEGPGGNPYAAFDEGFIMILKPN